jgi:pimeloyl-ACP methyl ester carboxylesterase
VLADLLTFRTPRPRRVLSADELARVTVPTLVAWGRRERFATVDDARTAVTRMPDATLHVVDGGHVPWLTDPTGIAWLICDPTPRRRRSDDARQPSRPERLTSQASRGDDHVDRRPI